MEPIALTLSYLASAPSLSLDAWPALLTLDLLGAPGLPMMPLQ